MSEGGGAPVTGEARGAGSRNASDSSRRIDLANAVTGGIRHINIALCVGADAFGAEQACRACGAVVADGVSSRDGIDLI